MIPKTFGLLIFSSFLMLVMGCTETTVPMPEYLLGTWVTPAPRYEDQYIEINRETILFGTGTGNSTFFMIKKIEENKIGEFVEWTFHCKTVENSPFNIVLFYTKDEDGAYFEIRNQRQNRWVKKQE